jgi:hypothetical protein
MLGNGKEARIVKIYPPVVLKTSITVKRVIAQYNIVRRAAVLCGWMASKPAFQEPFCIPHQGTE